MIGSLALSTVFHSVDGYCIGLHVVPGACNGSGRLLQSKPFIPEHSSIERAAVEFEPRSNRTAHEAALCKYNGACQIPLIRELKVFFVRFTADVQLISVRCPVGALRSKGEVRCFAQQNGAGFRCGAAALFYRDRQPERIGTVCVRFKILRDRRPIAADRPVAHFARVTIKNQIDRMFFCRPDIEGMFRAQQLHPVDHTQIPGLQGVIGIGSIRSLPGNAVPDASPTLACDFSHCGTIHQNHAAFQGQILPEEGIVLQFVILACIRTVNYKTTRRSIRPAGALFAHRRSVILQLDDQRVLCTCAAAGFHVR